MPEAIDISGARFGRLLAVSRAAPLANGQTAWLCQCDCGKTSVVSTNHLRCGRTISCGCYGDERRRANIKHGHARGRAAKPKRSPTYRSWRAMMDRCYQPSNAGYARYGAIGVAIDARWHDFNEFLADMGERPAGASLDRINPFGNYEPRNCRWATAKLQRRNTRVNWLKRATVRRVIAERLHSGMCA